MVGFEITGSADGNELVSVCAVFIPGPELSPRADCSVMSAVSELSGAFLHSPCFMIPVMTLSVSAGMFCVSAVWFVLLGNFCMSLSFCVVVLPVLGCPLV